MVLEDIKAEYNNKGYDIIIDKRGKYNIITANNTFVGICNSIEELADGVSRLKPFVEREERHIYCRQAVIYPTLYECVKMGLEKANIDAIVYKNKKGEHSVKISSETDISNIKIHINDDIIAINKGSDMFGNVFYWGGRLKKTRIC